MGLTPGALPVGPDRAPIWPQEVVGSISHCNGFVGAVVASTQRFAGVGLDAEVATPLESNLVQDVCTDQEMAGAGQVHPDMLMAAQLIFCAKEAVFKAVYPACSVWLNFGDVELTFAGSTGSFQVGWVRNHSDLPNSSLVSGRIEITPSHFLSGVVLSRDIPG
jgi:4'-phosphopantetheinyl transferase EntD